MSTSAAAAAAAAAADHGYRVTLVEDATSSLSAEWQHAATSYALTNIATISDTATVTAALTARAV